MRDRYGQLRDAGAEVLAVSADPLGAVAGGAGLARLPFPVLSDADLTAIKRYGVLHEDEPEGRRIARPALFLIDRDGYVRFAHVGEHTRDRPAVGLIPLALESLT